MKLWKPRWGRTMHERWEATRLRFWRLRSRLWRAVSAVTERRIHETVRWARVAWRCRSWESKSEDWVRSAVKRWGALWRRSSWVWNCWFRKLNWVLERSLGLGKERVEGEGSSITVSKIKSGGKWENPALSILYLEGSGSFYNFFLTTSAAVGSGSVNPNLPIWVYCNPLLTRIDPSIYKLNISLLYQKLVFIYSLILYMQFVNYTSTYYTWTTQLFVIR